MPTNVDTWKRPPTLTARASAFLIEMARMIDFTSFCFIAEKDVEPPGLMGYSTPRLVNVAPSVGGLEEINPLGDPSRGIYQNVCRFQGRRE